MKCSGDHVILRGIVFHYISCYIVENGFSARQKFGLLFGQCSNRRNQQHFLSLAVRCLYCFRFHFIDFWPKTASIQFNSIWPPCGQIILYLYNIICILLLLWYLQSNAKMQLSRKQIFWQCNAVSKIQERVKIRNWTNFPLFKTDIFSNSSIFIKISVIKRWNKSSSTRNSAKLSWAPSRTALNQAERCPGECWVAVTAPKHNLLHLQPTQA